MAKETELSKEALLTFDKRAFLEALQRLQADFASDDGNPGSYECKACERCTQCMFCRDCDACYQCTHCTGCELCTNCSHCVDSKSLNACAYCVQSESCTSSAYVVLSRNLVDCNYCFGCVGLAKKDFHILNVAFSRQEYFLTVAKLKKQLDIR